MGQNAKKIYEKAEIDIILLEMNDIITESGGNENNSGWPTDGELDQDGWDS